MAKTITLEITDTEYRCLEYIAADPVDFVDNAATFRANEAKEEILPLLVAHCNANDIAIETGEAAQIEQAYALGVIKTAKVRNEEAEAELEGK